LAEKKNHKLSWFPDGFLFLQLNSLVLEVVFFYSLECVSSSKITDQAEEEKKANGKTFWILLSSLLFA